MSAGGVRRALRVARTIADTVSIGNHGDALGRGLARMGLRVPKGFVLGNQIKCSDFADLAASRAESLVNQDGSSSLGMRAHADLDEVDAVGQPNAGVVLSVPAQRLRSHGELAIRG